MCGLSPDGGGGDDNNNYIHASLFVGDQSPGKQIRALPDVMIHASSVWESSTMALNHDAKIQAMPVRENEPRAGSWWRDPRPAPPGRHRILVVLYLLANVATWSVHAPHDGACANVPYAPMTREKSTECKLERWRNHQRLVRQERAANDNDGDGAYATFVDDVPQVAAALTRRVALREDRRLCAGRAATEAAPLLRWLGKEPHLVRHGRVVELGAGAVGVLGFGAAAMGAESVVLADFDARVGTKRRALHVAAQNAEVAFTPPLPARSTRVLAISGGVANATAGWRAHERVEMNGTSTWHATTIGTADAVLVADPLGLLGHQLDAGEAIGEMFVSILRDCMHTHGALLLLAQIPRGRTNEWSRVRLTLERERGLRRAFADVALDVDASTNHVTDLAHESVLVAAYRRRSN